MFYIIICSFLNKRNAVQPIQPVQELIQERQNTVQELIQNLVQERQNIIIEEPKEVVDDGYRTIEFYNVNKKPFLHVRVIKECSDFIDNSISRNFCMKTHGYFTRDMVMENFSKMLLIDMYEQTNKVKFTRQKISTY